MRFLSLPDEQNAAGTTPAPSPFSPPFHRILISAWNLFAGTKKSSYENWKLLPVYLNLDLNLSILLEIQRRAVGRGEGILQDGSARLLEFVEA